MEIGSIVYVVDLFLTEARRCKIIGEEPIRALTKKGVNLWKVKDSIDGSLNYSFKETTFATIEEANAYIEYLLEARWEKLVEQTNTKEKLMNYFYNLAKANETDNKVLEYLEKEIEKHTSVKLT